ncbi:hypothetical protein COW20_01965 [bacterium (Candidatus Blackallbacteria) CG13_big_fil_rev_8_21_14_2_50_49_14]|nr:MAG: hypothetical protein COW20_01965 [bacterium (Candidatus Blackallbacteria) CG13_big_fil_rev_8_21_14_2_50_49_14]
MAQADLEKKTPSLESAIFSALERIQSFFHSPLLLEELVLSPLQRRIVQKIARSLDPLTLTDLAKELSLSKSTLSISLQSLTQHKIIYKVSNPKDQRQKYLCLTDFGKSCAQKLESFSDKVLQSLGQIPNGHQVQFLRALLEFIHQLQLEDLIQAEGLCLSCSYFAEQEEAYCHLLKKPMSETHFPLNWYQS